MSENKTNRQGIFKKTLFIILSLIIIFILFLLLFKSCSNPTYTITFKDYDGTIIDVVEVKKGEIPSTDKTPSRSSDDLYEYVFDSWGNIIRANGDATYKAIYNSILLNKKDTDDNKIIYEDDNKDINPGDLEGQYYYINFLDDDGSVIESRTFKYGSFPYCTKDIPNKTIDGYLYTFAGWNKTLSKVTGNATYRATYNKTYVGGGSSGGGGSSEPSVTKYTVTFVTNNGNKTQQVVSGGKATAPDINFNGYAYEASDWYEDEGYNTLWDFDTGTITEAKTLYGKWNNKYAVVFDHKGKGTNITKVVTSGSTVASETPTYTGYEFIQWQYTHISDRGGEVTEGYDFSTPVTGPLTLYAQWGVEYYFNTEPFGQPYIPSPITIPIGDTVSSAAIGVVSPKSEYDGKYMSSGIWYKNSAKTAVYDMDQQVNSPGPITLYVGWNIVVNLKKVHGGEIEPIPVPPGSKLTKPADPVDVLDDGEDYIFKGWYTDENTFLNPFNFNTNITAPLTLYSKWARVFTVTFDTTDLSESIDPIVVETGSKISMPETTIPSGHVFKGWFKDNLLQNQWDFNNDTVTADTTLYPRVDVSVSFNKHGHGGSASIDPISVRPGEKITAPSPEPSETGYIFKGWYKDDAYTQKWKFEDDTVTEPITLHALWQVSVTYDLQGKGENNTVHVNINNTLDEPAVVPTYSGYLFKGWYKDQNCTDANKWDFETPVTVSTTLYAKWVEIPSKFDIITINNKKYRVLKVNDNTALVVALYKAYSSGGQFSSSSSTVYKESDLDTLLDTTWYGGLETNDSSLKSAIVKTTDLKQNKYVWNSGSPSGEYIAKGTYGSSSTPYHITSGDTSATIGDRYVFALDVQDIVDYLGKDNLSMNNIRSMFDFTSSGDTNSGYIWLRTARHGENNAFYIDDISGYLRSDPVGDAHPVYPAFSIDFTKDFNYSLTKTDKYTITVNVDDDDHGTVSTSGGTYPENFEVLVNAKGKDGYMFSEWDDGNTDNPRVITVAEDKTYTAKFVEKNPAKGDIVTLDNKKYRILSYDSNTGYAKLLSLFDLPVEQKYYETNVPTTIGGYGAPEYDGSDLDKYLNTTWYGSLDSNIKNAIVADSNLKQNIYCLDPIKVDGCITYVEHSNYGWGTLDMYLYDNNIQGISIPDKYVYAPGASDMITYLGKDNLTIKNVGRMFYDSDEISNNIWLRSANSSFPEVPSQDDDAYALSLSNSYKNLNGSYISSQYAVHAMFTINLNASGIEYDLTKVPKVTVSVSADDDSHGSVEGSGTYNEGSEVFITAVPKEGYMFVKWSDDSWENINSPRRLTLEEDITLEATFAKLPSVGDIIKLNDNKNYRVMNLDGSKALLIGLYSVDSKAYNASSNNTTFNGTSGIKYHDSDLDKYLKNWSDAFYNDDTLRPLYYAAEYTDIVQNMYTYHDGTPTDDTFVARGIKGDDSSYYLTDKYPDDNYAYYQKAFILDISHLTDYLGEDNLTKNNINKILFNSDSFSDSIWFASADSSSPSKAFYYNGSTGAISSDSISTAHSVYPALVVDLSSHDGFTFDIVTEVSKHTITVSSDDNDMGSVRITGGPEFIDGTEVLLTAKPNTGYKFVKWKIDGADDSSTDKNNPVRTITVEADKEYTAVFEELDLPSQGEVIKIGDADRYRVLTLNGTKALVVALFNAKDSQPYWDTTAETTTFGTGTPEVMGVKYDGSSLDTYLNTTWYGEQSTELKGAIVKATNLTQGMYQRNNGIPSVNSYIAKGKNKYSSDYHILKGENYNPVSINDKFVFALDVQDIVNYFNGDDLSSEKLKAIFEIENDVFWLRSAITPGENEAFIITGDDGEFFHKESTNEHAARPAFYVDLSKLDFVLDDTVQRYHITVSANDDDKGTVAGEGDCNKGGAITISATPNPGFKFVQWDDGNTDNPRTVIVTDEHTYVAEFDIRMPVKGDVIKVDDMNFKVLSMNDKTAFVVSLSNISENQKFNNAFDNKYEGSDLDNFLNDWYTNSLDPESSLKKGIIETIDLQQYNYSYHENLPTDDNYVLKGSYDRGHYNFYIKYVDSPVTIGNRYVFALEIKDIADYLGGEDYSQDNIQELFGSNSGDILLRSDNNSNNFSVWNIALQTGVFNEPTTTDTGCVRPAFYIDLSADGVSFEIVEPE